MLGKGGGGWVLQSNGGWGGLDSRHHTIDSGNSKRRSTKLHTSKLWKTLDYLQLNCPHLILSFEWFFFFVFFSWVYTNCYFNYINYLVRSKYIELRRYWSLLLLKVLFFFSLSTNNWHPLDIASLSWTAIQIFDFNQQCEDSSLQSKQTNEYN